MLAQSITYALRAIQSREHPLLDRKKPPHKRGAAFYKTMRSFNRAWVQPSQAFDQERARREIYSAASSVAGFSALGAAALVVAFLTVVVARLRVVVLAAGFASTATLA